MSENQFYTPAQVVDHSIQGQVTKANLPLGKMLLLGILAGAFIAIGGTASSVAAHNITNVGVARTVAGAIFPVGLMLVILVGGELFTGNCLLIMAALDKKITTLAVIRNLVLVYLSNFVGAFIIDLLVFYSGQFNYSNGGLGAYTIKVAIGKATISPVAGITSGILCNILVCLAILMAAAAKDVNGKIWAIFFPILAFVVCGFEHCVANMFYIPAGMLAATNSTYVAKAEELYGITAAQCQALLSPSSCICFSYVTLGNILGGMLFVGAICYAIHKTNWKKA
ncbi:MAG: formate/nitrite transporter family protein [Lachnospiraceae bacterium]|nr:formate/nitrite transporter family protein [Lachnospiraceae bacterium]